MSHHKPAKDCRFSELSVWVSGVAADCNLISWADCADRGRNSQLPWGRSSMNIFEGSRRIARLTAVGIAVSALVVRSTLGVVATRWSSRRGY